MLIKNMGHILVSKFFTPCVFLYHLQAVVTKVERISETLTKALSFSAPLGVRSRQEDNVFNMWEKRMGRKEEVACHLPLFVLSLSRALRKSI